MLTQYHTRLRADDAGADAGGTATIDAPAEVSDSQMNDAFRSMASEQRQAAPANKPVETAPAPAAKTEMAKTPSKTVDAADFLGLTSTTPKAATAPAPEPAKSSLDTSKEFQTKLAGPSDRSSDATKTNWKQLNEITDAVRTERDAIRAEKSKLEAELSEARKLIGNPDELKRIKEEHNYALEKLKVISVKDHPEFKAKFTEPKNQLTEKAAKTLKEYEVGDVDIRSLAGKRGKEFANEVTKIAGELPEFERHVFIDDMRKLRDLSEAESSELARSGELASLYQQKTVNQQRGVFEKLWSEGQGSVLKAKDIPVTATPEERRELEEYNSGISGIRAEAEKFLFNPYSEETAAKMALKASTLDFMVTKGIPKLNGYIQSQAAKIEELQSELASMRAHGPGSFDGGKTSSSAPAEPSDDDINAAFRSMVKR